MNKMVNSIQNQLTKIHPILIWLIIAHPAYRVIVNGIRKFDTEGMWTDAFQDWGYPVWFRILVGILETGGGFIVLVPKIRHFGGILLAMVMIGALLTRIVNGTGLDDALTIAFYAFLFLFAASSHKKVKFRFHLEFLVKGFDCKTFWNSENNV
ncbi:MAG: DoxX family protein [Flavobacteriaceae bacterium]